MKYRCDPDIFQNGEPVAIIGDRSGDEVEVLVSKIANDTAQKVDWFYMVGCAVVKCVGDCEKVRAAFREHARILSYVVESDGRWTK